MHVATPCLSIGLPVFNGGDYLEIQLQSILAQTYSNFEFIISDNASTDSTEEICRRYAARDKRIKYHRNPKNIGATQNWYRVLDLASGEYFASVAHDDFYAAEYMEKCISVLERDPSILVCYSKARIISEDGVLLDDKRIESMLETVIDTTSAKPSVRFHNAISVNHLCMQMYGVMRADALRRTTVFAGYFGCDWNTLAELALLGKLYEIPEFLFFHRVYRDSLGAAVYSGHSIQELFSLDPGTNWNERFPALKRYRNYFGSVAKAPIPMSEKLRSYGSISYAIGNKVAKRIGRFLGK